MLFDLVCSDERLKDKCLSLENEVVSFKNLPESISKFSDTKLRGFASIYTYSGCTCVIKEAIMNVVRREFKARGQEIPKNDFPFLG
jgi:hypothetical protein